MFYDNILWFKQIGKKDIGKVGGKGANLGEMTKCGFPVPNGFVVTAQAYFNFIKSTEIEKEIISKIDAIDVENTEQLQRVSQQVRELIIRTSMNEELSIEIQKEYMKLGEHQTGLGKLSSMNQEFVAIRSSATAEDLPEASFAGQQETYLNVKGKEEVVEAVKKCWASLFTARATYYRRKQGFKTEQVGIAVVVQRMVNSFSSGVMFTSEPTGDRSKIIIEAGYGLGEAVVSGSITPDHYVVDGRNFRIIEKKINPQKWKIIKQGRENTKIELSQTEKESQKLPDELIKEVAKIGKAIERHYGMPQDIEWATEGKELFITQTRAITTLDTGKKAEEKGLGKISAELKPIVIGLGASPGIVFGKVALVSGMNELTKVIEGDIMTTGMTNPDMVPIMRKAAGIITNEGGQTCHAAIVSRELGIPCVVGTGNATKILKDSQEVTVDGYHGKIYAGKIELEAPESKVETEIVEDHELEELGKAIGRKIGVGELKAKEDESLSGEKERVIDLLQQIATKVKVNVALPEAAEAAAKTGADGVGLLRAEHMITASGIHPAEFIRRGETNKLVEAVKKGIRTVAEKFKGKPVWYRTFDARSDEFRNLEGGEKEPKEDNPMLGWHGIRRDLDEPELLKAQFKAIKELREEGLKNVGVMLPFVISPDEVRKAKEIALEAGLNVNEPDFDFGVMIETPAAVMVARALFAEGIKFISFGTNDLTQLTLGIDRNNERIQKDFSELHPAIRKMVKRTIKRAIEADVITSICGQAASNPEMVKILVRAGIDSVSANIDAVEEIKRLVLIEEKNMILEKLHKKRVKSLL